MRSTQNLIIEVMHQLIYAIVQAESGLEALTTGTEMFDELIASEDNIFDYYVTFYKEEGPAAGRGRWGDLPAFAAIDSEDGRGLVERGVESMTESANTESLRSASVFYDRNANEIKHREEVQRLMTSGNKYWIVPADIHY